VPTSVVLDVFQISLLPATACSWELLPGAMASKRGGHAVAAAGGQVYALGGFNSVQAIPHCEAYEPRVSGRLVTCFTHREQLRKCSVVVLPSAACSGSRHMASRMLAGMGCGTHARNCTAAAMLVPANHPSHPTPPLVCRR